MVSSQKRALTSSAGALLIDELTDWLDAQIDGERSAARGASLPPGSRTRGGTGRARVLPAAPGDAATSTSTPRSCSASEESLGWDLARAREPRPRRRRGSGRPVEDRDYRFAVMQSELYRRYLRLAVQRLDVRPLAHYLKHLSIWYLERDRERVGGAGRAHAARPQRARPRAGGRAMSTLLIDNYDSYTYNVFHLLAAVSGEEPIVVRNDVVSWRALSRWDFDAIVLSPGPGRPERWHDFGVCADILRSSEMPVLGVCLGHQGLGHLLDGDGARARRWSCTAASAPSRHDGDGLFEGIPQDFSVVRYHSLAVTAGSGRRVA